MRVYLRMIKLMAIDVFGLIGSILIPMFALFAFIGWYHTLSYEATHTGFMLWVKGIMGFGLLGFFAIFIAIMLLEWVKDCKRMAK